jgi:hypothetical protein
MSRITNKANVNNNDDDAIKNIINQENIIFFVLLAFLRKEMEILMLAKMK